MSHYPATLMLPRAAPSVTVHHAAEGIGWQALGPALVCTVLAWIIVALRWYSRANIAECIGLDDYVILGSVTLVSILTTLTGLQVHHGINGSSSAQSPTEIAKLMTVNNVLWILTVNTTKASILVQYLRVFSDRTFQILCYILLGALLPAAFWGIFAGVFMCRSISALWDPRINGVCLNATDYWLSVSGVDIGLDFLILALPLPAVLRLRLPRKQKMGLFVVFGLGFFVCIISVVRLIAVLVPSLEGEDVVAGLWAIVWSSVEANVGIICASLLALKPLAVKVWPALVEGDTTPAASLHLNLIEDPKIENEDLEQGRLGSGNSSANPTSSEASRSDEEGSEGSPKKKEEGNLGQTYTAVENNDEADILTLPSLTEDVIQSPKRTDNHERVLDEGFRLEGHEGWATPLTPSPTGAKESEDS